MRENKKFYQYAIKSDNSLYGVGKTTDTAFSGYYDINVPYDEPLQLIPHNIQTDDLIIFKNSYVETIIDDINSFWDKASVFESNGFLHRRGVLIYGKNGIGKSKILNIIINYLIEYGGIALNADTKPKHLESAISLIRDIEPDRPIICLFEDIDELLAKYGENDILSILDGNKSTNHVLNLATTNYIDKLPKRLKSRPRRFDRIIKIELPDENIREQFFRQKMNVDEKELKNIVKKTAGFSIAALTEVVISMTCFDMSLEETCKIVSSQLNFEDTYDEYDTSPEVRGFCDDDITVTNEDIKKLFESLD